jgi:hypothetical protein
MPTYYVDQTGGNDGDTGLSTVNAWKTMGKISGFGFAAGDVCLLKRGEVWRETWYVNTGGAAGNVITYGAYGNGAKPRITGCDLLAGWAVHAGNVYVAAYVDAIDTYLLLEDGEHLTKVANLAAVNGAGKFWPDNPNNLIYVWCTDGADPGTHTMEIGARYDAIDCNNRAYVTFEDLHFHGAGGQYGRAFGTKPTWFTPTNIILNRCEISHAYFSGYWLDHADTFNASDTMQLDDCEIHHNLVFGMRVDGENAVRPITNFQIGGGSVHDNGNATIGQFGTYLTYCAAPIVTLCEIYDNSGTLDWSDNLYFTLCTDLQATYNTVHGGNHSGIHLDVHSYGLVHHNTVYGCTWNGIWIEEHQVGSGDVTGIYHNTCYHNLHGLVFGPGSTIHEVSGVTCENNIFSYNRRANVELNDDVGYDFITGNVLDYNCYQTDPTPDPLYVGEFLKDSPRAAHTFAEWKAETGWDAHSINADPIMINPAGLDFRLRQNSPCKDNGIVLAGADQIVKGRGPDVGRYELQPSPSMLRFGGRMRPL